MSGLPELALLVQLAATLYMLGLIWFVQAVHYPLFGMVGERQFSAYEVAHCARTNWVVGPPMLAELGSALFLVWQAPAGVPPAAAWLGLGLLGVVWISTALLQVPRHAELTDGFDAAAHRALVSTNWLRTAAWSARGLLVLWMTARAMT